MDGTFLCCLAQVCPESMETATENTLHLFTRMIHQHQIHQEINMDSEPVDHNVHIDNLPHCVLLKVFSHLALFDLLLTVEPVSRQWQSLALDRSLWKTLSFPWEKAVFLTDEWLVTLLRKIGLGLEIINLERCTMLTEKSLRAIVDVSLPHLKRIVWPADNQIIIPAETFYNFVLNYPDLEEYGFNVKFCGGYMSTLETYSSGNLRSLDCYMDDEDTLNTDDSVQSSLCTIAAKSPGLRSFRTNFVAENTLQVFAQLCPMLAELSLSGCTNNSVVLVLQHISQLEELDISNTFVDDRELCTALDECSQLTRINISACSKITDVGIIAMAQKCPRLKQVVLNKERYSFGGNVTDVGLAEIGKYLPHMEQFHIQFCPSVSSYGIEQLANNCAEIRELYVRGCTLSNSAFFALADNCKELRLLDASECLQVRCGVMEKLLTSLPKLETLLLESCSFIKDVCLSQPTAAQEDTPCSVTGAREIDRQLHSNITVLNVRFCCGLQPTDLMSIAKFCPRLQCLDLGACWRITDSSIDILTSHCPLLHTLYIGNYCTFRTQMLTDQSLHGIASNCKQLESLHTTNNVKQTIAGLKDVLSRCRTLICLSLTLRDQIAFDELTDVMMSIRGTYHVMSSSDDGRTLTRNSTKATRTFVFPKLRFRDNKC